MRYKTGLIGFTLLSFLQGSNAAESTPLIRVIVKNNPQIAASFASTGQLSKTFKLPINSITPIAGDAYSLTVKEGDVRQLLTVKSNPLDAVLAQLRKNPQVIYAVQDRVGHFKPLPIPKTDDINFPLTHELQWDEFKAPGGMRLESAAGLRDGAWAYTTGMASQPIVVAVLDTGVALNDSLVDNLVKDANGRVWGWNFAANNRDISDETQSYHGTHVAGTIAAFGQVMIGVGENLKVLPVKIPDASGMFYESQVINAIYWAVGGKVPGAPLNPHVAKVLNMSFGVDENPGKEKEQCDVALQDALDFARERGAVITVAAGNENRWEHYNAPAVCNNTIKVAATGPMGLRAYYSNYGPGISFAAPGGDIRYGKQGGIFSTVKPQGGYQGSGFDFYQGTSMASPHAAGVAGLIFALYDGAITPAKVEQILSATTHAFGESTDQNKSCTGSKPCGPGILDAENAVKATLANYDVIFNAPVGDKLTLNTCAKGGYEAHISPANWLAQRLVCQDKASYQRPELQQTKDGKIVAHYGKAEYVLDSASFKRCQVIGNNGIGCYY
ncbi:MAG: S8 family serine peptidase [Legionella sp.]|nr:S8 family serine peptidase [Legionella sp.]